MHLQYPLEAPDMPFVICFDLPMRTRVIAKRKQLLTAIRNFIEKQDC